MIAYTLATTFLPTFVLQVGLLLYHNVSIRSGWSRAFITSTNGTVQVHLTLPRPLKVKAGQYIGIWIPGVSFWSFSQVHPFIVASWSEEKQPSLDIIVEPRRGLTQDLLQYGKTHDNSFRKLESELRIKLKRDKPY
jgi:hypothetical protein